MTMAKRHAQCRSAAPFAATLAAILLAGCSSGHVGESWQCPLAKGGSCGSVAAADPAVPDRAVRDRAVRDRAVRDRAAGKSDLREPLYRVRSGDRSRAPTETPAETPCDSGCGTGFDPFGWLMRLFGAEGREDARSPEGKSPPAEPAAAGLPDTSDRAADEESGDDLRSAETVARIWIAPFVDANGVYREAAHVRVVLAPAGWRLK